MQDRESLCGKYFVPLKRIKDGRVEYAIVPVRCGSWECPECRARKADAYRRRIGKLFDGRKLWMVTLTYFHSIPPEQAWKEYNAAWNRLKANLSKQCGKFSFVRVLESHEKSPYPHLHVILDREIKPTLFNRAVLQAGFGYQMELKKVTTARAAEYIAKYLTKGWTNETSLAIIKKNRVRRISFSRDIICDAESKAGWELLGLPTGLEQASDCIECDRTFDTAHRYSLIGEIVRDDFVMLTYETEDLPPDFYRRRDLNDWEPDDWKPR